MLRRAAREAEFRAASEGLRAFGVIGSSRLPHSARELTGAAGIWSDFAFVENFR